MMERTLPLFNTTMANGEPPDSRINHEDALEYWNGVAPNVDGMLGGIPQVSRTDLRGSSTFLAKVRKTSGKSATELFGRGVDCGAGIGRVTAGFLSTVCEVVDVVEPVEKFASQVSKQDFVGKGRLGEVYVTGLEKWTPEKEYDLIWAQWCLGHLTDVQLVELFRRCKGKLTAGGWLVIKENMSTMPGGEDIFDDVDSSVTRTDEKFRQLIEEASLNIVRTELQNGFPKALYPVRMYAMQPKKV
jgi:protein N-terminal methyltransferase